MDNKSPYVLIGAAMMLFIAAVVGSNREKIGQLFSGTIGGENGPWPLLLALTLTNVGGYAAGVGGLRPHGVARYVRFGRPHRFGVGRSWGPTADGRRGGVRRWVDRTGRPGLG